MKITDDRLLAAVYPARRLTYSQANLQSLPLPVAVPMVPPTDDTGSRFRSETTGNAANVSSFASYYTDPNGSMGGSGDVPPSTVCPLVPRDIAAVRGYGALDATLQFRPDFTGNCRPDGSVDPG